MVIKLISSIIVILFIVGCRPKKIDNLDFIPDKEENVEPQPQPQPQQKVFNPELSSEAESAYKNNKKSVLYFNAVWCGACKQQKPIMDEVISENGNTVFIIVDVDKCKEFAKSMSITGIPTTIIGEKRFVGVASKREIQKEINEAL